LYFSSEAVPVLAEFITPGQPKAMLYLASGESVPVGDSPLTILDPNVAEVNVKEGGELTYAAREEVTALQGATHRISIPRGGEFSAVLGDGTKVRLNSRTELSYPVHFSKESREVYLEGEAYFEVAKAGRPFVVHAGGLDVRVLGTEFNVNTQTAGTVKTVLVTGSVEISSGKETVRLTPNQLAIYRSGDEHFSVQRVDVTPHVAWKDNNFVFDKERLEDIMETLSLWYDMEVIYENDLVKETRLTGDLERYEEVQKLLYFFEKTSSGLHFEIVGKTVIVR
jgi:ferric-dicitrate binding protein FerR (iron transport regulator)